MIRIGGSEEYSSFYIFHEKYGAYLTKHKEWIGFPEIDIAWWKSREEAEEFLRQYLQKLPEEEFAEYIAERILE